MKKSKLLSFAIAFILCLVLSKNVYADIKGDLDGDGVVTAYDAYLSLLMTDEEQIADEELIITDINNDQQVTQEDTDLILKYAAGIVEDESMWIVESEEEEPINNYYYEQLNDNEKIIYDGLARAQEKAVADKQKINLGTGLNDYLKQDNESIKEQNTNALIAFQYDHADNINVDEVSITPYITMENNEIVNGGKLTTYLPTNMKDVDIKQAKEDLENAKNEAIKGLAGKTDYDKILYLHDYLIKVNDYDYTYGKATGSYNAYGALVKGCSVCEGYAKAYKYLLNSVDIECEIIVSATHAWNAVKLEEQWYYVDCTWDDLGGSKISYEYFLRGEDLESVRAHTLEKLGKLVYPNMSKTAYRK